MKPDMLNIHYESPDFERNLHFYRDILQLPVKTVFHTPHRRGVIFEVGPAAELEFFGPPDDTNDRPVPQINARIKIMVEDATAEFARLEQQATITAPIEIKPWGECAFTLRAPDGLVITISQLV